MTRHGPQVDAEPVRRHITRLLAGGWTQERIAATAGCSTSTIRDLDERDRRTPPEPLAPTSPGASPP